MGRDINEIIADLPPEQQAQIEARYLVLKRDYERLLAEHEIDSASAVSAKPHAPASLGRKKPSARSRKPAKLNANTKNP